MRISIGTDIVYIPKMRKLMENDAFIRKVFHSSEFTGSTAEHIAGIFAAKEAFFKAINRKPDWLKVEIKSKKSGRPALETADELKDKFTDIDVSISHEKDYAIATVLVTNKER